MKRFYGLIFFLLFFYFWGSLSIASGSTISWGDINEATYDLSIPGSKFLWTDPLIYGGMNLKTGEMTSGKDADVAFSSKGEVGAKKIVDIGLVDFNNVNQFDHSTTSYAINAIKDHVYLLELIDGTLVKLQIKNISITEINIKYALEEEEDLPQLTAIKFKENLTYSPSPINLTVIASYSDNTTTVVKNAVQWISSNAVVAKVSNGVVEFTGKPGTVKITASYNGQETSKTVIVVKNISINDEE